VGTGIGAGKRTIRVELGGPGAVRPTRVRMAILFLTVFVDLIGFGIILPLLPFYADRFGASGTVIGGLVVSYSLAQLVFAPLWGRLSDRYGRRPILIVGLLGSAVSYLLFAFAGSLWALFFSRMLAGIGGANIPVAQAYVADITPPERRAGGMGLIGAAFGLGFIVGPALGGILAPISPQAPGFAAAGLCFANALLAMAFLPESHSRPAAGRDGTAVPSSSEASESRLTTLRRLTRHPSFRQILGLSFLFTAGFSVIHPIFPLFAASRFGLEEREVGWLFAFMGVISAAMQGGVVRALVPRLGERGLLRVCSVPFFFGLLGLAFAPNLGLLLGSLAALAIGFGGTLPSLVSLLSRLSPAEGQGANLGLGQSVGAMARVVGPLLGGISWDLFGGSGPFLSGAILVLLAAIWGRTLPDLAPSSTS
jgi:MFS transporter, DHA1 family, tetracycline resistance protein